MVTLVALRIGTAYGILKNHTLCFDNRFNVEIGWENDHIDIEISDNKNHIPDFFGHHLSSMTAIVGKNGVGKSTLLRYLKDIFIRDKGELQERKDDIIIFWENNEFKILVNEVHRSKVHIKGQYRETDPLFYKGYPKIIDRVKNLTAVYYSNTAELGQSENESVSFYNISTGFLLENIGKLNSKLRNRSIRSQNAHNRFRFTELKRQIEFFREFNKNSQSMDIPFRTIDKLQVQFKDLAASEYSKLKTEIDVIIRAAMDAKTTVTNITIDRNDLLIFSKKIKDFLSEIQHFFAAGKKQYATGMLINYYTLSVNENLFFLLLRNTIMELLLLKDKIPILSRLYDDLLIIYGSLLNSPLSPSSIPDIIINLRNIFENLPAITKQDKSVDKFIQKLTQLFDELNEFNNFISDMLSWGILENTTFYFDTNDTRIENLLERYYGTSINLRFIRFDWARLSAGEESLIAFFSRLQQVANASKNENLLLFIDEGDLYFHPEWQRKYIYYLLNYLRSDFVDFKKIQIILTTHSPFIVADLPPDNIIFLDRQEDGVRTINAAANEIETFGGNLHALYSQAFFLGTATTSEFALQKIRREIISPLENGIDSIDVKSIRKLIQLIGEPVIKSALEERLNRKYSDDTKNNG